MKKYLQLPSLKKPSHRLAIKNIYEAHTLARSNYAHAFDFPTLQSITRSLKSQQVFILSKIMHINKVRIIR